MGILLLGVCTVSMVFGDDEKSTVSAHGDSVIHAQPEGQVLTFDCGECSKTLIFWCQTYFFEPFRDGWSTRWVNSTDGD